MSSSKRIQKHDVNEQHDAHPIIAAVVALPQSAVPPIIYFSMNKKNILN